MSTNPHQVPLPKAARPPSDVSVVAAAPLTARKVVSGIALEIAEQVVIQQLEPRLDSIPREVPGLAFFDAVSELGAGSKAVWVLCPHPASLLWSTCALPAMHRDGWSSDWVSCGGQSDIVSLIPPSGSPAIKLLSAESQVPGQWDAIFREQVAWATRGSTQPVDEYLRNARAWVEIACIERCWDLARSLAAELDRPRPQMTLASTAWASWRQQHDDRLVCYRSPRLLSSMRAASYGPRVEARRLGVLEEGEVVRIDVQSLYPSILAQTAVPTRLHAWCQTPELAEIRAALDERWVLAECTVEVDIPALPARRKGRTVWPTGRWRTWLPDPELRMALDRGWVRAVHQAQSWDTDDCWSDWVLDVWVKRRAAKCRGDDRLAALLKIAANSIIGRAGAKHSLMIDEAAEPLTTADQGWVTMRRSALPEQYREVDVPAVGDEAEADPWIACREISLLGHKVTEVLGTWSPWSIPQVYVHVLSAGRRRLTEAMEAIGWADAWYVDTDSVIAPASAVEASGLKLRDNELGAWREDGRAAWVDIHSAKVYSLGGELTAAGLAPQARLTAPDRWEWAARMGVSEALSSGVVEGAPVLDRTYSLKMQPYARQQVDAGGRVKPLVMTDA